MPLPAPSPASRPRVTASHLVATPGADTSAPTAADENDRVLREVRRVLGSLRFGSVTLIVQDGRVVQIDTTSKLRLSAGGNGVGRGS